LSLFQVDAGTEWRGGQRQSFLLAKELQKRGYPLHFVVQPGSPLHTKALEAHLPVLPLRMRSELDAGAAIRLSHHLKRKRCKLVHFHDALSLGVGTGSDFLTRVPIRVLSRRVDFPLKKNFLSRLKYRRNVDGVIAISDAVKNVLVSGGVNSGIISVIPSGIDFSVFEESSSSDYLRKELSFEEDHYLVGIVAHLADHKGHKYLIQATQFLKEKAPMVKIIIVGEGPLMMDLTEQAKETHVEDMVFFLGFREDIHQILSSLDLFVLSSFLEGMGSSILDAMAHRLPVVATQVGGIPEVVIHEDTGLLVPPRRPDAMAQAILRLYKDRKLAARLGQRGYEVVNRKFSSESMALRIIDLYERLARKKNISLS
jgi:glycosyltransferase involved in cell wall biosynthesis